MLIIFILSGLKLIGLQLAEDWLAECQRIRSCRIWISQPCYCKHVLGLLCWPAIQLIKIIHLMYIYFIYSWTQHTSTKMNLSSETQDLFLECLGFARHITLEAPGIFCRIEVNLGPNSFKYETGECPPRTITRWHSGRGRRTGFCSAPSCHMGTTPCSPGAS